MSHLPDADRVGTLIGSYRLEEVLGRGAMGTVFRAVHAYIGRPCALKLLGAKWAEDEEALARFLREARAASAVSSPHIVDVTDFGRDVDGRPYYVMELCVGRTLEAAIQGGVPLALHRTLHVADQIAAGAGAAHDVGIVHRDLKPENVMLLSRAGRRTLVEQTADGALRAGPEPTWELVKLLDFGVAHVSSAHIAGAAAPISATDAGMVLGTPEYMSPEAASGERVDARADVYALGTVIYDMLVGTPPFRGGTAVEILARQISEAPVPPREARPDAEITPALEALVMAMLAKDPAARPPDMTAVRAGLAASYGTIMFRRNAAARGGLVLPRAPVSPARELAHGSAVEEVVDQGAAPLVGQSPTSLPERGTESAPILLTRRT